MKIISEDTPHICLPKDKSLSFLYENKSCRYALEENGETLFSFKESGYTSVKLAHCFTKLIFIEKSGEYMALYHHPEKPKSGLYILDLYLNETDFIPLTTQTKGFCAIDVAILNKKNCILALSKNKLTSFNTNGDCLGLIMSAPKGRCYKAFCVCGDIIFIAYETLGCLYIAAYDSCGCFLERISVGSEYTLKNMQLLNDTRQNIIQLFLYKNKKFPTIIKISLTHSEENYPLNKHKISIAESTPQLLSVHPDVSCNLKDNFNVNYGIESLNISQESHDSFIINCTNDCPPPCESFDCKKNIIC